MSLNTAHYVRSIQIIDEKNPITNIMKSSILLIVLVGSLICISPTFGKDEFLGAFKSHTHDIGGDIYSKGDNQLGGLHMF